MADRNLTDLELERELAGDLPAARMAEANDADRARLGELRAESEAFLRSVDVDMEVRRINQRIERERPQPRAWWRWLVPAGALAAAAAVLLVFLRRDHGTGKAPDDDLQTKGDGVTLIIHLATSGESQRLDSGDSVKPGDRIRFEVDAPGPGFVAILGVDGSGKSTIYYPDGIEAAHYTPEDRLVPGAIELDSTPGDEHFTVVFSPKPFHTDALPSSVKRDEIVLHKK